MMPWIPCLAIFLFCLAGNSAPSATANSVHLPKIRVSADGRAFIAAPDTPFVPFGVTYYRPGTGWAPQVWNQFDPDATRNDFARMKSVGVNCVRVFLSYHSFYPQPGTLNSVGLKKFDRFLDIAEAAGIYVQPTGPDAWEGPPAGQSVAVEDENTVLALEQFWKLFAARYRGRSVIFAYELKNEPSVPWQSSLLEKRWNTWLVEKYPSSRTLQAAWNTAEPLELGRVPIPIATNSLHNRRLSDYQDFRESVAVGWTQRQVAAIKSADPEALVTLGLIQWSVPVFLPGSISDYSAFRPSHQARFLDLLEIHFYPLAGGALEYQSLEAETQNLGYLESVVREVAQAGKPTVLAEFGWYGGGQPRFDGGTHPAATEEQQARYCRRAVETSAGFVCGWFNWGFYDDPEATDVSELTGLFSATGKIKMWGNAFAQLARKYETKKPAAPKIGARPVLDWDAARTSTQAGREFAQAYGQAFRAEELQQKGD
jgi:hypothetical protein